MYSETVEGHSSGGIDGSPFLSFVSITLQTELDKEKWEERAWPSGQGWHRAANRVKWLTFLRPLKSTWPFFVFLPVNSPPFSSSHCLVSSLSRFFPSTFLLYFFPHPHSAATYLATHPVPNLKLLRFNLCNVKCLLFHLDYTISFQPILLFLEAITVNGYLFFTIIILFFMIPQSL